MKRTPICLSCSSSFHLPDTEQIFRMADLGFDGFFTLWEYGAPTAACRAAADRSGMLYQSIHAPFTNSARLWQNGPEADIAVQELVDCVHACADAEVPLMVAHAFIGFKDHTPTQAGIDHFGQVVREAQRCGVSVAFENTEGEEYLDALLSAFADAPNVGFCLDSGHQLCYNRGRDLLADYGSRLLGLHLNDNLGITDPANITWHDDLHLLPFDGIVDWPALTAQLRACRFAGPLTFELTTVSKPDRHENDVYAAMPLDDYLRAVYERACRVRELFEA